MALPESMDLPLFTGPSLGSNPTQMRELSVGPLLAKLADANTRIATLESELVGKREALTQLLAEDLRTCEELSALQKIIWGYHREMPGSCDCAVCAEVEQSERELERLVE